MTNHADAASNVMSDNEFCVQRRLLDPGWTLPSFDNCAQHPASVQRNELDAKVIGVQWLTSCVLAYGRFAGVRRCSTEVDRCRRLSRRQNDARRSDMIVGISPQSSRR